MPWAQYCAQFRRKDPSEDALRAVLNLARRIAIASGCRLTDAEDVAQIVCRAVASAGPGITSCDRFDHYVVRAAKRAAYAHRESVLKSDVHQRSEVAEETLQAEDEHVLALLDLHESVWAICKDWVQKDRSQRALALAIVLRKKRELDLPLPLGMGMPKSPERDVVRRCLKELYRRLHTVLVRRAGVDLPIRLWTTHSDDALRVEELRGFLTVLSRRECSVLVDRSRHLCKRADLWLQRHDAPIVVNVVNHRERRCVGLVAVRADDVERLGAAKRGTPVLLRLHNPGDDLPAVVVRAGSVSVDFGDWLDPHERLGLVLKLNKECVELTAG